MKTPYDIISKPLLTEKSSKIKEAQNKIVFKVARDANKIEIKKAVEEVFNVKVLKVATMNFLGKTKRTRLRKGKRPDWKKAIVTLKPGEKIQVLEGL
ncbi:MAG: 50S ribosomal protein L23 [Nitrospirota bacterium]